ncbi:unnamed protein product [Caenorhabditis angaria]|uniref:Uncharacterized protein n=1 Tax=Caenorhabditis angaria TaxID=860376 RepID=A0A9P1IE44_9PELO|nr:unnamed protein product [Caenorhabditis angaria]
MAEDGYEVMGPGGAKPQPIAPPPPPAALESAQEKTQEKTAPKSTATVTEKSNKTKKKKKKEKEELTVGDGTGVNQRPNSCDTILLALTCVVLILVIAASIPMILAGFGVADIESLRKSMEKEE